MEQRSPEWFAARCGKATASRIADIVAKTKTGWGASRANYAAQLIAERLTGVPVEGYRSAEMKWGEETEEQARGAYEFHTDREVMTTGFIEHPTVARSGASPDGFVEAVGLLEIKCPNTATHIDTLLGTPIPDKYLLQMQWQMACTGREWCDFVSFDPRLPERMRLWVKRINRDYSAIEWLEREVRIFLDELDERLGQLKRLYP